MTSAFDFNMSPTTRANSLTITSGLRGREALVREPARDRRPEQRQSQGQQEVPGAHGLNQEKPEHEERDREHRGRQYPSHRGAPSSPFGGAGNAVTFARSTASMYSWRSWSERAAVWASLIVGPAATVNTPQRPSRATTGAASAARTTGGWRQPPDQNVRIPVRESATRASRPQRPESHRRTPPRAGRPRGRRRQEAIAADSMAALGRAPQTPRDVLRLAGPRLLRRRRAHKALLHAANVEVAIVLGTVRAVGGGVMRDLLLNRVPRDPSRRRPIARRPRCRRHPGHRASQRVALRPDVACASRSACASSSGSSPCATPGGFPWSANTEATVLRLASHVACG